MSFFQQRIRLTSKSPQRYPSGTCRHELTRHQLTKSTRLVGALFLAAFPVAAHHSFAAEYDDNKPVKVTGVVTKIDWQNPHSWIYIDVKSPDGKVASWAFSASPPGVLMRRGVTREDLKPGTVIKLDGYRAKDGSNNGYGVKVTFEDGRSLYVSGPNDAVR